MHANRLSRCSRSFQPECPAGALVLDPSCFTMPSHDLKRHRFLSRIRWRLGGIHPRLREAMSDSSAFGPSFRGQSLESFLRRALVPPLETAPDLRRRCAASTTSANKPDACAIPRPERAADHRPPSIVTPGSGSQRGALQPHRDRAPAARLGPMPAWRLDRRCRVAVETGSLPHQPCASVRQE